MKLSMRYPFPVKFKPGVCLAHGCSEVVGRNTPFCILHRRLLNQMRARESMQEKREREQVKKRPKSRSLVFNGEAALWTLHDEKTALQLAKERGLNVANMRLLIRARRKQLARESRLESIEGPAEPSLNSCVSRSKLRCNKCGHVSVELVPNFCSQCGAVLHAENGSNVEPALAPGQELVEPGKRDV